MMWSVRLNGEPLGLLCGLARYADWAGKPQVVPEFDDRLGPAVQRRDLDAGKRRTRLMGRGQEDIERRGRNPAPTAANLHGRNLARGPRFNDRGAAEGEERGVFVGAEA